MQSMLTFGLLAVWNLSIFQNEQSTEIMSQLSALLVIDYNWIQMNGGPRNPGWCWFYAATELIQEGSIGIKKFSTGSRNKIFHSRQLKYNDGINNKFIDFNLTIMQLKATINETWKFLAIYQNQIIGCC